MQFALDLQRLIVLVSVWVSMSISGSEIEIESLDSIQPWKTVSLQFMLLLATRLHQIAGNDYEADWHGDGVMAMRPPGVRHPIYQRSA